MSQSCLTRFLKILVCCAAISLSRAQDLPVEIQADLLLTAAKQQIDAGNWSEAVKSMQKLTRLKTTLPAEFHFHYGKAMEKAGMVTGSVREILIYLTKTVGNGTHDKEATSLLLELKNTRLPAHPVAFPKEMPVARQATLLLQSIKFNDDGKHHHHAVSDFDQLKSLNVELPDDYPFLYGRALLRADDPFGAKEQLAAYFKKHGKSGKHYHESLSLFLEAGKKGEGVNAEPKVRQGAAEKCGGWLVLGFPVIGSQ